MEGHERVMEEQGRIREGPGKVQGRIGGTTLHAKWQSPATSSNTHSLTLCAYRAAVTSRIEYL